jgi:membrane protein DedA with SNARE-associated domain
VALPAFLRDAIRWLVGVALAHQYALLFAIVAIEEAGVPLPAPSDVVIAAYGYRARADPLAIASVILICAAASTAGTLVPYALTWRYGDRVARRLAGLIEIEHATIARWEERIRRGGFVAVLVGRLIPGARVAMSLLAGTSRVPIYAFSPAVFIAAAIYWTVWVLIGVALGPALRRLAGPYITYVLIALPIVFVAYLVFRLLRARGRPTPGARPGAPPIAGG